ncbi:MAG: lysylphosphatidylglycerol synthase transmembrane domain-containing protein [Chloroflexota bacterium]
MLVSAALLVFILSVSDITRLFDRIASIPRSTLAVVFGFAATYLLLKGWQFRNFLEILEIHTTRRQLALAYAVGEMTLALPAGTYATNWVLERIEGADFARSSAATTAVLIVEATFSMVILVILGIPAWPWLRWVILGFFGLAAIGVAVLYWVDWFRQQIVDFLRRGRVALVGEGLLELIEGLITFIRLDTIVRAALIGTTYMLILATAFLLVAEGVGIPTPNFHEASTIYFFGLTAALILPVSTQLGVVEATGVGAAVAWGYTFTEGLAMLLGFRLVWLASIWVICGPIVFALRGDLSQSPRNRG